MNEPLAPIPEAVPDELPGTVAGCHKRISDLLKGQFALQSRLNELEERLKLNSRNSSKPPSGDGAGGTSGRNKPRSRRKRGGQPEPKAAIFPQARLRRVLQRAVTQQTCTKTANTCDNLLKLWPAMWHFLANPAVPPTNNHAERAIRGVVLRRKISYLTRSGRGLRFVERVFAAAYSCRQQGKSLFHFLNNTFHASLNCLPCPSLVPGAE